MEHTYFERELKYLLAEKQIITIEDIVAIFNQHGYTFGQRKDGSSEIKTRTKLEEYLDDDNFTLLKRGDVLRRTRHIWYDQTEPGDANFMYKENVANAGDLHAARVEKKDLAIKDLLEFIQKFNVPICSTPTPKLKATIIRNDAVMIKGPERFYVTHDTTTYQNAEDQSYCESMLEVEDKTTIPGDQHLRKINSMLLQSGLKLQPTQQSKYERGCENLIRQI